MWPITPTTPFSPRGLPLDTIVAHVNTGNVITVPGLFGQWDATPGASGTGVTFSGGNMVATFSVSNTACRSLNTKSGGKWYFNVLTQASGGPFVGVGNANALLNNFLGSTADSATIQMLAGAPNTGRMFCNFGGGTTAIPGFLWVTGDEIGVAVDDTALLIWFRDNTQGLGWTNAVDGSLTGNPAAGTGGLSIAAIGAVPIYAMASSANFGDQMTLRSGSGLGQPPVGFGWWKY